MRTLIFGYGNYDRQDDGVAWHVITSLRRSLNIPNPDQVDEDFDQIDDLVFVFQLQLTPELAEWIVQFDRVCFIDAHTGSIPEEVRFAPVLSDYKASPLTHHLTPESLLSITQSIYNKIPEAVLLSVRGYEFEFTQELSMKTQSLIPQSVSTLIEWLSFD